LNRVFKEAGGRFQPRTKCRFMPTHHPLQGHNLTISFNINHLSFCTSVISISFLLSIQLTSFLLFYFTFLFHNLFFILFLNILFIFFFLIFWNKNLLLCKTLQSFPNFRFPVFFILLYFYACILFLFISHSL
jgi:hypothetical protein